MPAQEVIAIRWERKRGTLLKDLAKKYGLSQGYISHIAAGNYYPHIGGPLTEPQTHCIRGHEYTPENTVIKTSGTRNCRTCKNELEKERKRIRRANERAVRAGV